MTIITLVSKVTTDESTEAVVLDAMQCATKVYNGLIWHLRAQYKETGSSPCQQAELEQNNETVASAAGILFIVRSSYP